MPTKITKKDYFATLATIVETLDRPDRDELLAFIEHEVDLLTKKSSSTKPTAKQKANSDIKNEIVNALRAIGKPVTVSELLTCAPNISELVEGSNQRASALLTQLSDPKHGDCRVERFVEKKRAMFKVV